MCCLVISSSEIFIANKLSFMVSNYMLTTLRLQLIVAVVLIFVSFLVTLLFVVS